MDGPSNIHLTDESLLLMNDMQNDQQLLKKGHLERIYVV
jgi:hypothetical protein